MLEINHLSKRFGKLEAVNDVHLDVKDGEIFGFLGPNGAGKTTTIKCIAGLQHPSAGFIRINGHDVHHDPLQAKAALSYIPDEPYLYEKLSGREYLELVGQLHLMQHEDIQTRIDELLKLFGIEEYQAELTEGYSHGTRQKFVFTAALLPRPELLLVDEPLVGLDPQNAHLVKELLRLIARDHHVTIFMSTHTLSLAQEICDRIGIIHRGRLVALGTLADLQQQASTVNQNLETMYLKLTGESAHVQLSW